MRQERSHTKVIATIGPVTRNKEILEKLIHEGVDVFRINLSHDTHEEHLKTIRYIQELNEELGSNVAILGDLQGPKLRVGDMENGKVLLEDGQKFSFVTAPCTGTSEKAYLSYEKLPADVTIGERILVDDGKLIFEVTGSNNTDTVSCSVIAGGPLSSKKGVNLPHTKISQPSLTEKDIKDAQFILDHQVDWIALSFVRKEKDILDLRKIIDAHSSYAGIIAKIEKPEALEEIEGINLQLVDPYVKEYNHLVKDMDKALTETDLVLVGVNHTDFKAIDFGAIQVPVFDTRNFVEEEHRVLLKDKYHLIGKGQ